MDWNKQDKYFEDIVDLCKVGEVRDSKREYFASKYQWLKENHPEYWVWDQDFQFGINFLDKLSTSNYNSILDVGCGSGQFCRLVKDANMCNIVNGTDIVDVVSVSRDNIEFNFEGCAQELPYKDNQFDVVTSFDVLEHVIEEDVSSVLDEIFRVASKEVFLAICHRESWSYREEIGELHATNKSKDWWDGQLVRFLKGEYYWHQYKKDTIFWAIEV